jgi:hypothetical protein
MANEPYLVGEVRLLFLLLRRRVLDDEDDKDEDERLRLDGVIIY